MKILSLSFLRCIAFGIILLVINGCGTTNSIQAIPYGTFSSDNPLRDPAQPGNYVLKEDGTIIPYSSPDQLKIAFTSLTVNGQKINNKDVKGYQQNRKFYILDHGYHEVIAEGKISIYDYNQSISHYNGSTSGFARYAYKTKKGEYQPLVLDRLKDLVKDCPYAYEKLNITPSKVAEEIKHNPRFLNEIVEYYNNGCK